MTDILRHSFLLFLLLGSFAGVLIGVVMMVRPKRLATLNHALSHWVGSGALHAMLDRSRSTERFFYRHNRLVGSGMLIGALGVLYTFMFSHNLRKLSSFVSNRYWWLSDAIIGLLLVGTVLAALVGLIVLLKPSLLREIEQSTNRWISTERLTSSLGEANHSLERAMFRYHELTGALLMLGGLYAFISLGYFLWLGKV